jgi:hypothetical protein
MSISKKAKKQLILALVVVLVIAAAIGIYEYRKLTDTTPMVFDQAVWLHNPPIRHRMLDSLMKEYELIGMHRTELVALLGEAGLQSNAYLIRKYIFTDGAQILSFILDEQNCVVSWEVWDHWV